MARLLVAVATAALSLALWAQGTAHAAVTSVSVVSATELGKYDGRPYREVQLRVRGMAPGGGYDVPATLAYPIHPKHHSGIAVVDVVNTVFVLWPTLGGVLPPPATPQPLYVARLHLGDEYLFGSGHVYLSVTWDKDALALLGTGAIASPGDAFSIIRDVAALARMPGAVPFQARPAPSRTIVGYGFSQTGNLLRGFLHEHVNSAGGLAFDGACTAAPAASASTRPSPRSAATRAATAQSPTARR